MEAKDTVMSDEEIDKAINGGILTWVTDTTKSSKPEEMVIVICNVVAQAQAEISFQVALKAVGEWLASITISGNAVANELRIAEGIVKLKHGEMPKNG